MKNIRKKVVLLLLVALGFSCELPNDTVDPSRLQPQAADPDFLLNSIQLNFASFYNSASNNTDQLVRMQAMTGGFRYQNAISPASTNGLWGWAYQTALININTLIPIATARNFTTHVAMAKIFEAYIYLTLVDIYGDVPQSEALKGTNFNPKLDNAADVYAYAITRLTEARTELAKTGNDVGRLPASDFYYPGLGAAARTNWTAVANTLELKAQMNLRMVSASAADTRVDQLLASNIIDTEAENFTFKWGTATVPDSRHPLYNQYYGPNAGSAGGYIANYFLNELFRGRGVQDPRWRYYFYRQVGSIVPSNTVPAFDIKALGCAPGAPPPHYQAVGAVYCVFEPGFYGRDHGDNSGTPPDGPVITCAGVYPAGGRPDNNSTANTAYNTPSQRGNGANGAGISPIWMSFYTNFLRAELLARRGDPTGAETQMLAGINGSITQVKNFAVSRGQAVTPASLEPSTSAYIAAVQTAYSAATNKLDVIGREFYVSLWGNGVEAYNSYRRTSAPRGFQPTLQTGEGPWVRSFVYPLSYTSLANPNAVKDPNVTNKVFWDTNPETLK
ncbi:MAG: SusD/RagB family nutrient-binding outer membrane lipoprotein [Bacteroidota bacterium]|jgi:hypothetical protein|nr:SusD/RagB family nutrient-binding outer membrane lipoprotein [Cytophagales bacterium]